MAKPNYLVKKKSNSTYKTAGVVILILVIIAAALLSSRAAPVSRLPLTRRRTAVSSTTTTPYRAAGRSRRRQDCRRSERKGGGRHDQHSMNTSPNFATHFHGNLMIVNESVNNYPQVVEIVRNDTNERFTPPALSPWAAKSRTQSSTLTSKKVLTTALPCSTTVDPETGSYLGLPCDYHRYRP
jgi:hypothetical protein